MNNPFLQTDYELMETQVNVLFKHNAVGRMTAINEPSIKSAPRFFMGITKQGNVVRYHETLDEDVKNELEQFAEKAPWSDAPNRVNMADIIRILSKERPVDHVYLGPAYVFPDMRGRSTQAIKITQMNIELLEPYFSDFVNDVIYGQPAFAVVQDQAAVSLCSNARSSSIAAEASLHTARDFRGRAYGLEAATAWAAEIQNQGRIALYSTAWNNFASQAVARKLKLRQYGMDLHFS
ncbi:N-acetyltransferase [Paenibacillus chitinolyticus]|uniref:N-acetyltransferase n=1 Tax=Paenibacillus chitinolyticus TaxID=79263 RepID=A0A410WU85_9BACL|nr:GNAT family N-acetyltransferase [Paenibacillus chitinolyticus]MCY9591886.1 GNAT family N-acetyltransferase [Paenibacillus chitinolyticus]MCY9595186.1 GNAT family N-acetyltransferase [Paenibacillus chitinolyticus]QAV18046.1 N-acetyltransferase [Paenibacillus chitinolyticus]